jgi:hypothetical protein
MALTPQDSEGQSLVASPTEPKKNPFKPADLTDDEMAALDTCGKYGGYTEEGHPCDRLSAFGIPGANYGITPGKCHHHTDVRMEALAAKKAEFLERFMDQPANLTDICREMKIATSRPYVWKLTDKGFARVFDALVIIVDAVRHHIAEDAMFDRIRDIEAGADTLRMFFFQNRSKGRWRDVRKDPAPAPSGNTTIINTGGGDLTINRKVWQMGDDFVDF